ncbi:MULTISPECIES: hypothetical protein [unclassified Pseudoalteromonas]|uniref:hypothetical protein n=1 Tax=unclassified Pseudoalteromonas TaxID=194690 RepID=UPI00160264B6|nr:MULTISPECIES: hypothetical protein [unclassified Pseudoalteromonas]MBB1350452.1 hypothetical protein [Pseudoalteromonas sp. SG45-3]MBB1360445.1 hypothetical protein [Pseudoalteromonas sp. SG45-6]
MKKIFILPILSLFVTNLQAETAYISSDGSGSGYSESNPASIFRLNTLLNDTSIDVIELQAGTYKQDDALFINTGNHPVEVIGTERVVFTSDFNYYSGGNSGFVIARSNLTFKNIAFLNTRHCFRFKNNEVSNIVIDDISANNTMSCIEIDYNATESISNISINKLKSLGYYKAGIRINGQNTKNINITNSIIDGLAMSSDLERSCYITGVSISGPVSDILIDNLSISNNIGRIENCGSYQQGDGIMINADAKDILIKNTIISNSKDADLDIKGQNVTLERITSSGGKEARYNLKLWNNEFTCTECYINPANESAIQAINAQVKMVNSTIKVDETSRLCDMRNYSIDNASVDFYSSKFSYYGNLSFKPSQLSSCE